MMSIEECKRGSEKIKKKSLVGWLPHRRFIWAEQHPSLAFYRTKHEADGYNNRKYNDCVKVRITIEEIK